MFEYVLALKKGRKRKFSKNNIIVIIEQLNILQMQLLMF